MIVLARIDRDAPLLTYHWTPLRDVPVTVALPSPEPLASILAAVRAGRTVRRWRP